MTPVAAQRLLEQRAKALENVPVVFFSGARRWRITPHRLDVEADWGVGGRRRAAPGRRARPVARFPARPRPRLRHRHRAAGSGLRAGARLSAGPALEGARPAGARSGDRAEGPQAARRARAGGPRPRPRARGRDDRRRARVAVARAHGAAGEGREAEGDGGRPLRRARRRAPGALGADPSRARENVVAPAPGEDRAAARAPARRRDRARHRRAGRGGVVRAVRADRRAARRPTLGSPRPETARS